VEKPAPKPPKLDEVAKLLAESKDKPAPKPAPAQKPPSSAESHETRPSPDLAAISRLLSAEAPQAKLATGRELNRVASVGAPNATAQHMSPSMSDSLNGLLQAQYKACWNYIALSSGPKYVARIHVTYLPDGSLAATPALMNPPSDPAARSLADSAMRAVRRCNPMKIPAQYLPYYQQWKDWVVGFDPDVMN
jgi:colicin import membrane protein